MGRKNMMHLSVCREKRKKKIWGAESSLLFFSRLLKPFFKGVSIYILLPAGVSSNNVYYMLPRGKASQSFLTPGRDFHFVSIATCACVQIKKKMCRKGHSTTLTKRLFYISVLSATPIIVHMCAPFLMCGRRKKKVFTSPGFHCLFVAGCKEKKEGVAAVPSHPSTSPLATQTCT